MSNEDIEKQRDEIHKTTEPKLEDLFQHQRIKQWTKIN